jgi:hypothetical protein
MNFYMFSQGRNPKAEAPTAMFYWSMRSTIKATANRFPTIRDLGDWLKHNAGKFLTEANAPPVSAGFYPPL